MAYTEEELKKELEQQEYQYGFTTKIESETFPVGLNEDIVRSISKKKNEPKWMTDWRLDAFSAWKKMEEPEWSNVTYKKPDFQAISYFSAPKTNTKYKSLDEVDPELLKTFDKLGISIEEQKKLSGVAVVIVVVDIVVVGVHTVDADFISVHIGLVPMQFVTAAYLVFLLRHWLHPVAIPSNSLKDR